MDVLLLIDCFCAGDPWGYNNLLPYQLTDFCLNAVASIVFSVLIAYSLSWVNIISMGVVSPISLMKIRRKYEIVGAVLPSTIFLYGLAQLFCSSEWYTRANTFRLLILTLALALLIIITIVSC